ncbi:unnamed protein product [Cuscuta europaea]|uniref:F-box domain-containing protein n=1 Tax=Cuscuta europaea TaxID=41803 RepID=A0A9P1EB83_CUSEU|nr:unnamed protein product [Cuscuta europaea]
MDQRDRIRELPAGILDNVLGLLPIVEAARTAVLSTYWRDAWYELSRLEFDEEYYNYMYDNLTPYLEVIDQVLKQHIGPIQKFSIYTTEKVYESEFDELFLLVTHKGIDAIGIYLDCNAFMKYRLPSCIFSCRTLKALHLFGVNIEPINAPLIFPNVNSLFFKSVRFGATNHHLHAVNVPMLESLSYTQCSGISHFDITAPKLGSLSIKGCFADVDDDDDDDGDDDERDGEVDNDGNDNGSATEKGENKLGSGFLPMNLDLTSIRTLHLCSDSIEGFVDDICKMRPKLLALNVEYLEFSGFYFPFSYVNSKFVKLLRRCPKLCELDICCQFGGLESTLGIDGVSDLLEDLHGIDQTHNRLHTLKFSLFRGLRPELLFIKELLVRFPTCVKLIISLNKMFDSHKKCEIMEELVCLTIDSTTRAEIVFV